MGINIPIIEGGFGNDKRVVLEKQIAEIHGMQVKEVRKSINRLIEKSRLKENIDFIDLMKHPDVNIHFNLSKFYAKASLTQAKNVFILSEEGYKIFLNTCMFETGNSELFLKEYFGCDDYVLVKDYSRKEILFFDKLELVLKGMGLKIDRQYRVGKYRIDGYISELNIAIEYDENNHKNYSYEAQEERQKKIEKILNCQFIRVHDGINDYENIGLVIKQMLLLNKCELKGGEK